MEDAKNTRAKINGMKEEVMEAREITEILKVKDAEIRRLEALVVRVTSSYCVIDGG